MRPAAVRGAFVALALALTGAGSAVAQPTLDPPALADAARTFAEQTARDEALIAELAGMGAVDQHLRLRFIALRRQARTDGERAALDGVFRQSFRPFDQRHAARLKSLLAGRPWFRVSEVGQRAEQAASLIVDHCNDLAFQKDVLAKMEPLVGVETPPGYANLYDRVAVEEGRPQRFGTRNPTCRDGRHAPPSDVEEPAGLEDRRRAVGLPPMADYLSQMDEVYGPCS